MAAISARARKSIETEIVRLRKRRNEAIEKRDGLDIVIRSYEEQILKLLSLFEEKTGES